MKRIEDEEILEMRKAGGVLRLRRAALWHFEIEGCFPQRIEKPRLQTSLRSSRAWKLGSREA